MTMEKHMVKQDNNKNSYIPIIIILIGYIILSFIIYYYSLTDILLSIHDKDAYGYEHVHIDEETGKAISQNLRNGGIEVGLTISMVGIIHILVNLVTDTSMPPMLRVMAVLGCGLFAGFPQSLF